MVVEGSSKGRRGRKIALATLVSLGCAVLVPEFVLRLLLFGEHPQLVALGEPFREPYRYSSPNTPEFWKLSTIFASRPQAIRTSHRKHPHYHPLLGTRRKIISVDFEHTSEPARGERRPVLFFGDSFAQCVIAVEKCWEDLLAESELGKTHYMLNYGVGSYGFDQITLMVENVLPLYVQDEPIVIVSLLVDDDIDRCYLPMRTYPKPYYVPVGDGELVLRRAPHVTPREFIEENPVGIRSYLARYILHALPLSTQTRLSWTGHGDHIELKGRIATHLIDRIHGLLEGAGVDYFFVLFHGPQGVKLRAQQWQDVFLREALESRGVPLVSSETYLRSAMEAGGEGQDAYFLTEGSGKGHYNDLGNEAVFQGILDGLRRRF